MTINNYQLMSRTYKATGINLKSIPIGESDRLLTIFTKEFGIIRAVAMGVRKGRSQIGGRSELFVVNQLLIAKGKSLDKITQAETLQSYSGLGRNLGKLASSQYLAELVLSQALSEQPQEELFGVFNEHLSRLENLPNSNDDKTPTLIIAHLTHGIFHLLALAGIVPQVQNCNVTGCTLTPNFIDPEWRVGFSISDGGTVSLPELVTVAAQQGENINLLLDNSQRPIPGPKRRPIRRQPHSKINAAELAILQQLALPELPQFESFCDFGDWISVERLLRQYAKYHLNCEIRSAALIDTYVETEQDI